MILETWDPWEPVGSQATCASLLSLLALDGFGKKTEQSWEANM